MYMFLLRCIGILQLPSDNIRQVVSHLTNRRDVRAFAGTCAIMRTAIGAEIREEVRTRWKYLRAGRFLAVRRAQSIIWYFNTFSMQKNVLKAVCKWLPTLSKLALSGGIREFVQEGVRDDIVQGFVFAKCNNTMLLRSVQGRNPFTDKKDLTSHTTVEQMLGVSDCQQAFALQQACLRCPIFRRNALNMVADFNACLTASGSDHHLFPMSLDESEHEGFVSPEDTAALQRLVAFLAAGRTVFADVLLLWIGLAQTVIAEILVDNEGF